jgi:hypothetical protein
MINLVSIALPFVVMGAVNGLAARYGRDSRPDFNESKRLS